MTDPTPHPDRHPPAALTASMLAENITYINQVSAPEVWADPADEPGEDGGAGRE